MPQYTLLEQKGFNNADALTLTAVVTTDPSLPQGFQTGSYITPDDCSTIELSVCSVGAPTVASQLRAFIFGQQIDIGGVVAKLTPSINYAEINTIATTTGEPFVFYNFSFSVNSKAIVSENLTAYSTAKPKSRLLNSTIDQTLVTTNTNATHVYKNAVNIFMPPSFYLIFQNINFDFPLFGYRLGYYS